MLKWTVRKWDGLEEIWSRDLPGRMGPNQVERLLQRLACRHLTDDEIISASLPKNAVGRTSILDETDFAQPMSYGENPHYTADWHPM